MVSEEPTEFIREKMVVERPVGTRLSKSHKGPGESSPLTRDNDTNELGQVTLSPITDERTGDARARELSLGAEIRNDVVSQIIHVVVAEVIDLAVAGAKPYVRKWWNDQALPAIKSTVESTRNRIRQDGQQVDTAELTTFAEAAPVESRELAAAPEGDRLRMSGVEAQERLVAALVARAFSDDQIRMLLNARIDDVDGFLAWKHSIEKFTPQQLNEQINSVLEANPSLLDEFARMFGGEPSGERPSLPMRIEGSEKPPIATDGLT